MSDMDTDREAVPVTKYVGWLWATGSVAIVGWLGGLALVAVDASLYDIPDTIVAGVLILAGCATIVCTQTALAYAQRLATRATGQAVTYRSSAAAATIQMAPVRVQGRVPADVVTTGASLRSTDRSSLQVLLNEAERPSQMGRSKYWQVYRDVMDDLGDLGDPPADDD